MIKPNLGDTIMARRLHFDGSVTGGVLSVTGTSNYRLAMPPKGYQEHLDIILQRQWQYSNGQLEWKTVETVFESQA